MLATTRVELLQNHLEKCCSFGSIRSGRPNSRQSSGPKGRQEQGIHFRPALSPASAAIHPSRPQLSLLRREGANVQIDGPGIHHGDAEHGDSKHRDSKHRDVER